MKASLPAAAGHAPQLEAAAGAAGQWILTMLMIKAILSRALGEQRAGASSMAMRQARRAEPLSTTQHNHRRTAEVQHGHEHKRFTSFNCAGRIR